MYSTVLLGLFRSPSYVDTVVAPCFSALSTLPNNLSVCLHFMFSTCVKVYDVLVSVSLFFAFHLRIINYRTRTDTNVLVNL